MSKRSPGYLVAPRKGTLASLSPAELAELDTEILGADLMAEAEPGRHASKATLTAGQAAVNRVNSARGRRS